MMASSPDSIDTASSALPVYETTPGSIIVPGLSGMHKSPWLSFTNLSTDAHAHILEYGWKMQLVLDGANSIEGPSAPPHNMPHRSQNVQRLSQESRRTFADILRLPTIRRHSFKVWDGIRTDGHQNNFQRL